MNKLFLIGCFTASLCVLSGCARNPVTGKKQVVLMSEKDEIAMGQQADPQIIAQFGLYEDQEMQNFISTKGEQMVAISHRPKLDFHFRVLNSEAVNAFAVPGGYVYFTRGILAYLNNEADFNGVLGHEIGHVTHRHSVAQHRNMILGQVGVIAGAILVPQLGNMIGTMSTGLQLLLLKYSRDAEREADELGVEYSTKIGYDAHEMAKFFTTLERQQTGTGAAELPELLSTHPNPGDRYVTVNKLATEWQTKLNLRNPIINRNNYLRRIDGLIYGEDPKEGFRMNNNFYHPVLRFQFPIPANWVYQNTAQMVQMAPQDGKAVLMLRLAPGHSLESAADSVLLGYQLTAVERRNISVNGLQAIYMIADQRPQDQNQPGIRTQSYIIQHNNTIYLLLGASSINDFNNYVQHFNYSMQGFRPLTDPSIINKKPDRVRIKTASSSMTLAQFLRQHNMPESKHNELAILNGMNLADIVQAGTMVKIISE
ncbi:MAG TPA: M48 family metalloprotease [Chitinophagaceae bacterium]|nr:M48 family metalloprotease [Chitinophagaceae bacterium]